MLHLCKDICKMEITELVQYSYGYPLITGNDKHRSALSQLGTKRQLIVSSITSEEKHRENKDKSSTPSHATKISCTLSYTNKTSRV